VPPASYDPNDEALYGGRRLRRAIRVVGHYRDENSMTSAGRWGWSGRLHQEFQVITNQFPPSTAILRPFVNVVTKSGTNQYHGTAFGLSVNKDLQARGFFRAYQAGFQAANSSGGSFGAPIIKDKTLGLRH